MNSVAFTPDGRTLASTGFDGTVRFWDMATGEPAANLPMIRENGATNVAAYSPDGTKLAIGRDGLVQIWDLAAGKEYSRSQIHPGRVWEVAFAPDGRTLATTSDGDSQVRIWDVTTGLERRTFTFDVETLYSRPVVFSRDGKRLAMGGRSRDSEPDGEVICIWELDGGDPTIIRNAHEGWLTSLAFTPEGTLVSCGCAIKRIPNPERKAQDWVGIPQIRVWDAISGRKLADLVLDSTLGMCKVALSRDGKTLVSAHRDRLVVWDIKSGKNIRTIPIDDNEDAVQSGRIAVSPEGRTIAAARGDNVVHLWDIKTGKPLLVQDQAHDTVVYSTAISPDGRLVATGDDKGTVRLWDPGRGEVLYRLGIGVRGRVWAVRFAPDGRTLAAASEYTDYQSVVNRGVVRLWDLPGLQLRHELRVDHRAVLVEFSPDSRRVAVASWNIQRQFAAPVKDGRASNDDVIGLFDVATGKKEVTLPGHDKLILAIAFARDGKSLASVGQDNTFRFWDLATGRIIREIPIEGHRLSVPPLGQEITNWIGAAAFSTDLKTAVSSRQLDDRLLVWDLRAGRIRRTIQTESYSYGAPAVSPDGRLLAWAMLPSSGKPDAPIRIWDMNTKREVLRLEPGVSGALSLAFSMDGKTLVSGMADTTAITWDVSAAYDAMKRPRE